jgi:hypothetical protein
MSLSRRTLTFGGIAAAALAAAGAWYELPRLFKGASRRADIVGRLADPRQAAILGRAVALDGIEEGAANDLQDKLRRTPLAQMLAEDAADPARVVEAGGWVIPLTLAEICALAAQSV